MGQNKSKQVYAFQPLPWPEALAAFRLIDQICGIASTYAKAHLDKHATVVLDKVNEIQRLPYLWDAFENDFERLRGTHLVRLATELHNVVDELEGCKYDMGMLAGKDITFKSQRKAAAEKVLAMLKQVEEAHRAFHYAFELALYGSLRDAPGQDDGGESTRRKLPESPKMVAGDDGAGLSDGGGGATRTDVLGAERAPQLTSPPPLTAAEDSWIGDKWFSEAASRGELSDTGGQPQQQQAADGTWDVDITPVSPQVQSSTSPRLMQRASPPRPPAAAAPRASSQGHRPATVDAATMACGDPPPPPLPPPNNPVTSPTALSLASPPSPSRSRSTARPSSSRAHLHSHSSRRWYDYDNRSFRDSSSGGDQLTETTAAEQQYVVMYMPQGPDGGGPRTLLVPSKALQLAPSSPGMSVSVRAATAVTGARSPFATGGRRLAYGPSLAAAPGGSITRPYPTGPPTSPALPPQPMLHPMSYSYMPSPQLSARPVAAPLPHPVSPPLVSYRWPPLSYTPQYGITASQQHQQQHNLNADSSLLMVSPYGLSYTHPQSPPHQSPSPELYHYLTPQDVVTSPPPQDPARVVPFLGTGPLSGLLQGDQSSLAYSTLTQRSNTRRSNTRRSSHSRTPSPPLSRTASGSPDLNSFLGRPRAGVSGGGSSGVWMSPLATEGEAAKSSARISGGGGGHRGGGGSGGRRNRRFGNGSRRTSDDDVYDMDFELGKLTRGRGGGGSGAHQTYSYGPKRAAPSYMPPSRANDSTEDHNRGGWRDEYDPYGNGGARSSRQYSDSGRAHGTSSSSGNRSRRAWDVNDVTDSVGTPTAIGRGPASWLRRPSYMAVAGPARSSLPPTLRGLFSRAAELEGMSSRAEVAAPAWRSSSRRAIPSPSYQWLAALAGLDPETPGGGAAAALSSLSGTPQKATSAPSTGKAVGKSAAVAEHPPLQVVPQETSLLRAELLSAALEKGSWGSAVELAALVRGGWWGDERDVAVARGLLMQAALKGGSLDAHAALGHMAERGEGLPGNRPDLVAAARHYSAAAAGGHRDATTALAYLMEHGLGVEQDEPHAAQLYATAAQRNCPTAANNLAKMILDGRGAVAAAIATNGGPNDLAAAATTAALSPLSLAKALFKRAANAGSTSAWYNLGMCMMQHLKQRLPVIVGVPLATAGHEDMEAEALRCFSEAANRGHARAALRAGYLHLQRSTAVAAVEAFTTAVLNTMAQLAVTGRQPPLVTPGPAGAGCEEPTAAASLAVKAEALWCLAQLAERQAAVLEVRKSSVVEATEPEGNGSAGRGTVSAVVRRQLSNISDRSGVGGVGGDVGADGSEGKRDRRQSNDGDDVGVGFTLAASGSGRPGTDDDVISTRTGGTENQAVGQVLATLAATATLQGSTAIAAAEVAAGSYRQVDDPASASAMRFAKEICRLDFSCCQLAAGHSPFTIPPPTADGGDGSLTQGAAVANLPIRGLRRLRRQARDIMAAEEEASSGGRGAAVATHGSISETSSLKGGNAVAVAAPVTVALARLDLELQQPEERARSARCAAAALMAAAAAHGYAAAQHWLAGWRWSMGQQAAAVALWVAAARRGHGASLMVLGQMAESGQLPSADEPNTVPTTGGADLAAAARYYLRAQEANAPGAVEAMRRVQKLLQRHVALQGKLEAVAAVGGGGVVAALAASAAAFRRSPLDRRASERNVRKG